jgi:hypothetical protein
MITPQQQDEKLYQPRTSENFFPDVTYSWLQGSSQFIENGKPQY